MARGKMFTEYYVDCSCGKCVPVGERTRVLAEGTARGYGWTFTASDGWRCPPCSKKAKDAAKEAAKKAAKAVSKPAVNETATLGELEDL